MINHHQLIRNRVRELEANEPFMNMMKAAKKRADDWEEALSITPTPDQVGDPTHVNLMASRHREHTAFRVKIKALYNRIKELEEQKKASASEGDAHLMKSMIKLMSYVNKPMIYGNSARHMPRIQSTAIM